MQPFDALSIRAVLQEAKPLLINRRVDRVFQLGRDEVLLSLRSKSGTVNLFLSAQSVYGRMCLVRMPSAEAVGNNSKERAIHDRYQSKYGAGAPPNFCLVLRKHLSGAILVGVEQLPGERIIDFIFSATDEVGSTSLKVLSAEIMGRHSNLIFWDKESEKILASSHAVTSDMSRQREVLPNLRYERPPKQDRQSIFSVSKEEFKAKLAELKIAAAPSAVAGSTVAALAGSAVGAAVGSSAGGSSAGGASVGRGSAAPTTGEPKPVPTTYEQWLIASFTGLGKHLSEELIAGAKLESQLADSITDEATPDTLWNQVKLLQAPTHFKPAVQADLNRYTVMGWHPNYNDELVWTKFPSVNDMVEYYFRALEAREQFIQLREKIKSEINAEAHRLETRNQVASEHLSAEGELVRLKKSGDTILSNLHAIKPGQTELVVPDWTQDDGAQLTIKLNPNVSGTQNAQTYYRQYAKLRARQGAAQSTIDEVTKRLNYLAELKKSCDESKDIAELRRTKETLSGRKVTQDRQPKTDSRGQQKQKSGQSGSKPKNLSLTSSDGWTIFVGRNRNENDHLLSKVANPNDLWFHVLGQGGAHVLIRVPSNKQEPPKTTIMEAAHVAARLSKAGTGAKVRVIYTQCKFVHKSDPNKPGLVRYENEKTVEVDTAKPMPKMMKKLFSN